MVKLWYNKNIMLEIVSFIIDKLPLIITAFLSLATYITSKKAKGVQIAIEAAVAPIKAELEEQKKANEQMVHELHQVRQDGTRAQFMIKLAHEPTNYDTILRIAYRYFVEQDGDWVMTNEFVQWAEKYHVAVPAAIHAAIQERHAEK